MNCTAWNSVDARRAQEEPERHAEDGVRDRERADSEHRRQRSARPSHAERNGARDHRLDGGHARAKASP